MHIGVLGLSVTTYSLVMTLYVLAAVALTASLNERQGIPRNVTLTLFAVALPAAIVGARLLDALEYQGSYHSLGDLLGRRGSSIYGGILGGVAAAWLYLSSRGISPLRCFDAGAPVMALGEAMTRVGCFLNGCCYGIPWSGPLAVTFPPEAFAYRDQLAHGLIPASASRSLPVHPVQLYSTVFMVLLSLYLWRRFLRRHAPGEVFFAFLVAYGSWRLVAASLRVEALASMKVFSAFFIVAGAVGLLARRTATHLAPASR